ncbi:porin family protein [Rhodoflexus caldus]|uniref:porin family protein n=1 Tax=Rhodoflexus caldus TaxID=2891236 RepID=UPI002029D67A|nr:porin family protein [Rhodoflexus caldus]
MENNFDDKLAQKFRESLENYPVAYEQGAWEQFNRNHLHKSPARMATLWQHPALRIAAAVLIAAVGLSAVYYWRMLPPTASTEIVSAQTVPQDNRPQSAEENTASAAVPDNTLQPNAEVAQKTMPLAKHTPSVARQKNGASGRTLSVESTPIITASKSIPQKNLQSEQRQLLPSTAEPVMLAQVDLLPLTLADSFSWQFPILAVAHLPVNDLATPQTGTVIKVQPGIQILSGITDGKTVNNHAAFYGVGAGVEWFLQKKVAVSTSIQFVQTTYKTPEKRFRVFNSLQRDPIGTQQLVPVYADETEYSRIRLNLVQVPLTIKYFIGKKIFFNAGGVSYLAVNGTHVETVAQNTFLGRVQNPRQSVENSVQPFRTIYLGGGVRMPLKGATLQVEPHLNLPLGDLLQDVNNTSLQWIGLNVGIYYGNAN